MIDLKARKAELSKAREAATYYRQQVGKLHEALQEETEEKRLHAADVLRSLVQRIVLTPEDGELKIEVVGDLAAILNIAVKPKPQTAPTANAASPTQNSRPVRAAVLSNLASQVEMVAGAGFEPTTFRL